MLSYIKKKIGALSDKGTVLLKNSIGAFVVKGAGFLVSLATLPALISFFNDKAVLGVWYTVLSVLAWINFFDLGIGNGLRNRLVVCFSENDMNKAKSLVSTAYAMVGILSFVFAVLLYALIPLVDWNAFLGIAEKDISPEIFNSSIRWISAGIILHFFLKLISSVIYAMQKSAWVNAISLFSSVIQLVFVLAWPSGSASDGLCILSRAYVLFTCLPYLAVSVFLFSGEMKSVSPDLRYVKSRALKHVLGLGGIFFFCQVLYMFIVGTNEFFVTVFFGPDATTEYSVYYKLFSIAGTLVLLALTPVWSLVTKAMAEGSHEWVSNLYRKSIKVVWLVFLLEVAVAVCFPTIIEIWIGSDVIEINLVALIVFVAWGTVFALQNIMSTFVCGIGEMRLQAVSYFFGSVIKIILICIVCRHFSNWAIVPLSNVLVLVPYCFIQHFDLKRRFAEASLK